MNLDGIRGDGSLGGPTRFRGDAGEGAVCCGSFHAGFPRPNRSDDGRAHNIKAHSTTPKIPFANKHSRFILRSVERFGTKQHRAYHSTTTRRLSGNRLQIWWRAGRLAPAAAVPFSADFFLREIAELPAVCAVKRDRRLRMGALTHKRARTRLFSLVCKNVQEARRDPT